MRRRAHDIGAWLRRRTDTAKEEVTAITAEMADIADASLAEAKKVAENARRGLRRAGEQASGKHRQNLPSWRRWSPAWTKWSPRPARAFRGKCQKVQLASSSLHDPDARPIKKGRIGKPVEFGTSHRS